MTTVADQENSVGISNTTIHNFQAMFPTKTEAQIESVLQKHHGDIASTIDELLTDQSTSFNSGNTALFYTADFSNFASAPSNCPTQMTSPVPPPPPYSEAIRSPAHPPRIQYALEPPASVNSNAPTSSSSSLTCGSISSSRRHHSADTIDHMAASITNRSRYRNTRMSLNEFKQEKRRLDILKKENEQKLEHVTDESQARILEDEQLALMMQDRELNRCMGIAPVNQRRSSSSFRPEMNAQPKQSRRATSPGPMVPQGPIVDEMLMQSTEKDFREKLKIISKASKARISQITSRFRKED